MNQTTTWVVCPFCSMTVYVETPGHRLRDAPAIENAARDHLVAYHPIRRRLHRNIRRAMRLTPA